LPGEKCRQMVEDRTLTGCAKADALDVPATSSPNSQ